MDIRESLVSALMLLVLGMVFVYLFLGLLFLIIKIMGKYIPMDKIVLTRKKQVASPASTQTQVNPQIIAAITSGIQQYRKNKSHNG